MMIYTYTIDTNKQMGSCACRQGSNDTKDELRPASEVSVLVSEIQSNHVRTVEDVHSASLQRATSQPLVDVVIIDTRSSVDGSHLHHRHAHSETSMSNFDTSTCTAQSGSSDLRMHHAHAGGMPLPQFHPLCARHSHDSAPLPPSDATPSLSGFHYYDQQQQQQQQQQHQQQHQEHPNQESSVGDAAAPPLLEAFAENRHHSEFALSATSGNSHFLRASAASKTSLHSGRGGVDSGSLWSGVCEHAKPPELTALAKFNSM